MWQRETYHVQRAAGFGPGRWTYCSGCRLDGMNQRNAKSWVLEHFLLIAGQCNVPEIDRGFVYSQATLEYTMSNIMTYSHLLECFLL